MSVSTEGPYIKYIDRDPEVLARQEAIKQKEKMAIDDEIRNQRMIEKQLKIAEELRRQEESSTSTEEPKVTLPLSLFLYLLKFLKV
jgi:DNA/RNA-binding protein KIN17